MIKSIVTIPCYIQNFKGEEIRFKDWDSIEEMLIPKVIGEVKEGFFNRARINRTLPSGHRYHGYEV